MRVLVACTAIIAMLFAQPLSAQNAQSVDSQDVLTLDRSTIALMPLENLSADPRAGAVAVAVEEQLRNQLDSIEGLHVVGGDMVRPYTDSTVPPEEAARLLSARTFLAGSIQVKDGEWQLDLDHIDARYGKCSQEEADCISGIAGGTGLRPEFGPNNEMATVHALPPFFFELIETTIFPDRRPSQEQIRADAEATFLNVALGEQDRLDALSRLSGPRMGSPEGPYSEAGIERLRGAVTIAAVEMAMSADEPWVRVGIWERMTGVDDPYLVGPLLHSLANDPNAYVREQAVKALRYFLDAPGVTGALEHAKNYDASDSVRALAEEYL